jgi:hypothetical protein
MSPIEEAKEAFNSGAYSSDNPYPINTAPWCDWMKEFGRLNDNYMKALVNDE